jgi:amino acid adenylation domain-containing protein
LPAVSLPGELSLSVNTVQDGGINARFFYNVNRYTPSFIQVIARHYGRLMESAAEYPTATLEDLELGTPEESGRIRNWCSGANSPQIPELHHVRFQEQVDLTPTKSAVVFTGGTLSYAELNVRANQMAHLLRDRGVKPNVPVAICMRRSSELVITYLGVIKAGGAIFLLDPATPTERIHTVLNVISPAVVLTRDPLDEGLTGGVWPVVSFDRIAVQLASEKNTAPVNHVTADDTAFLIMTSGSTGIPKIITMPARNRMGSGYEYAAVALQSPSDRHLLKTDSGTAFTHAEILSPLMSGGTLFVAPETLEYDPPQLASFIDEHRISCLLATPSLLSTFLNTEGIGPCNSLRVVECIGEPISPELKRRFFEIMKHSNLVISYGCSEVPGATGRVCFPIHEDPGIVDVGPPAPLMEAFVLDSKQRLTPVCVPGEVYLGGQLAAGYLNDPVGTAERFVAHGFSETPGARLFRTGDLGRWLPSGNLEILGRRDNQVKVRGFRIELGEIETRLAEHCDVSRCAVVIRQDKYGNGQLVGYWSSQSQTIATTSSLRNHLRARLPEHMVPSIFIFLKSMPLTSNGKLDRNALPTPKESRPELDTPYIGPSNPLEEQLAVIWSEVLAIPQVGIHDDFFDLGGHSLTAMQVRSRVQRVFELEIPFTWIFEFPTIENLALAMAPHIPSAE